MTDQLRSEQFMEQALDTWSGAVFRLALSYTRNATDAQDIVQDTFLALLRSTVAFQDDEHEKAWLLHVAVNRCREYHRSSWKRRVEPSDDMGRLAECAAEDPALEALFEHPVWATLAQLPDKLRTVVHLYYVEGYPTETIAAIAGVSPATVRTRLHRARKRLREDLDAQPEPLTIPEGANCETQSL